MAVIRPVASLESLQLRFARTPPRRAARIDPLHFGQRPIFGPDADRTMRASALNEDLRLFAMTFAAGFLFISLLIA